MKSVSKIYHMLLAGATAQAKWDYECSMRILGSRKRLVILGLLFLPCVLFAVAVAADQLPGMLGGHKAYGPSFSTPQLLWVLSACLPVSSPGASAPEADSSSPLP